MNKNLPPNYSKSKLYLQIFREDKEERFYQFLWTIDKYDTIGINNIYTCHFICIGEENHYLNITRSRQYAKAGFTNERDKVCFSFEISPALDKNKTKFNLKHRTRWCDQELEEFPFSAPNSCLEVICEIRLSRKSGIFPDLFIPLLETEQSYKIYKHMDEMFSSELFSDLMIQVGEKIFNVHKVVLANRSDVFATMLKANMKEKAENKIVIEDCEGEIFGEFLRYVYSNKLNLSNGKSAVEFFKLAEKYSLPDLKLDSSIFLARNLTADNVIQLQKFADLHEDSKLKEATMDYMSRNLSEVMKSPDWSSFTSSTNDVDTLFSILGKFISEDKIYEDFRPYK